MSYIRWSSDLKNTVPWEEELKMYQEGKTWEDVHNLRKERGWVCSDWYIFHHTNDLPDEDQTLENQLLSIWHNRKTGLDTFEYEQVKFMYDNDDWSDLTATNLTQKEVMRECVRVWLDDMEKEYGT